MILSTANIDYNRNHVILIQTNYAYSGIEQIIKRGAKYLSLKQEKMEAYWAWHQKSMEGKVFADNRYAKGWYRNDRGINWTLWPNGLVHYWLETRTLDISDYTLRY